MKNELISEIKKLQGFVLGIGLDDTLQDAIYENENIHKCDLMENMQRGKGSSAKGFTKSISIYQLKKKYKKNKIDFIICNLEDIDIYMKYFLRDGTYIVKQKIYLYGPLSDTEKEALQERLQRYDFCITYKQKKNQSLFILEKKECHYLKNYLYFVQDSISSYLDKISSILER